MKAALLAFILALASAALAQSNSPNQTGKTPIVITSSFNKGNTSFVEGSVRGASNASRLVLFLRLADQRGLIVAADESGTPILPRIVGNLPPPSSDSRNLIEARWQANFFVPSSHRVQDIYVVVCEVRQRSNSTPEGDYRSFQYLPFREAVDIDDALALLRDFAWLPTGFTRIAP